MKSTWMECNCQTEFSKSTGSWLKFELFSLIVPNAYCFIKRASCNQRLTDTHVKTCDFCLMEWTNNVIELGFFIMLKFNVRWQVKFWSNDLPRFCDCKELIFILTSRKADNTFIFLKCHERLRRIWRILLSYWDGHVFKNHFKWLSVVTFIWF